MNLAKKFLANLILVALVAFLLDIPMPWSAFDLNTHDVYTLIAASSVGWAISLTIGWGKFWYGVGYIISEMPWWMIAFA